MIENTTEYYYTDDNNQVVGPYTLAQIRKLRHQGQIFDDTQVCKAGETKWVQLGDVLAVLANNKRKEQAMNIKKTPSSSNEENKHSCQESGQEEGYTSLDSEEVEKRNQIDMFFKIVHTGLLTMIALLLVFQLRSGNSSLPTTTISEDSDKVSKEGDEFCTPVVPVAIRSSATLPVSLTATDIEYEYGAVHIDRETMAYAAERHKKENSDKLEPIEIPGYRLHIGGYKGWEYVGILCNDGINGSWILVRRKMKK